MPDWPSGSSAEPLRYQTMWVTTGTRRSGMTTTSRPLSRVKDDRLGPLPSVRPKEAASARSRGFEAVSMTFQPWRQQIISQDGSYGMLKLEVFPTGTPDLSLPPFPGDGA